MKMRKIFLLLVGLIVLFSFVSAEEGTITLADGSKISVVGEGRMGSCLTYDGVDVDFQQYVDRVFNVEQIGNGEIKVSFLSRINPNCGTFSVYDVNSGLSLAFESLKDTASDDNSYFVLDSKGELAELVFYVYGNDKKYTINGRKFIAPEDGRIEYNAIDKKIILTCYSEILLLNNGAGTYTEASCEPRFLGFLDGFSGNSNVEVSLVPIWSDGGIVGYKPRTISQGEVKTSWSYSRRLGINADGTYYVPSGEKVSYGGPRGFSFVTDSDMDIKIFDKEPSIKNKMDAYSELGNGESEFWIAVDEKGSEESNPKLFGPTILAREGALVDNVVTYRGGLPYRKQDGSIGQFKNVRGDAGVVRIGFVDSDRSVSGANANDEGGILTFSEYEGDSDDLSRNDFYLPFFQAKYGYVEAGGRLLDFENGEVSAGEIDKLYPNGVAITAGKKVPEMIFSYADMNSDAEGKTFYFPGQTGNVAFFARKLDDVGKPIYDISLEKDSSFIDKGVLEEVTSFYNKKDYSYDTDLYVKYLASMIPSNTKNPYTYLADMLGIKNKYSNTEEGWKKLFGNMELGNNSVFTSDLNYVYLSLFRDFYYMTKNLF